MSEHSEIMTLMQSQLEHMTGAVIVLPSSLAYATYSEISPGHTEDRLIEYLTLEMLKSMARKMLAGKFRVDGDDNTAHQGDLFSGTLQERYPLPRRKGEEPAYKLRQDLTAQERAYNVDQLRKSAQARLEHAQALEAEGALVA